MNRPRHWATGAPFKGERTLPLGGVAAAAAAWEAIVPGPGWVVLESMPDHGATPVPKHPNGIYAQTTLRTALEVRKPCIAIDGVFDVGSIYPSGALDLAPMHRFGTYAGSAEHSHPPPHTLPYNTHPVY